MPPYRMRHLPCLLLYLAAHLYIAAHLTRNCAAQVIEIDAGIAQEYLGKYQYFRSWKDKRRLLVVKGPDDVLDKILQDAVYGYRCQLAIRNVNLVLLGETFGKETLFFHSEDNRRDFVQTNDLSDTLRGNLYHYLVNLHRDLPRTNFWALVLGYDGGRKRMYRRGVNFANLFDKIDSMPMRQREMAQQRDKGVFCESNVA